MGEGRQRLGLVPCLDRIDQPDVLFEDLEEVAWIAPSPHLHQADKTAQLVHLGFAGSSTRMASTVCFPRRTCS